jgi:predicted transposase/invertase (TIGR01784 family)
VIGDKSSILDVRLEIHFINMVKFRKLKNRDIVNKPLERWLTFFDITTPEETLQEVIRMDGAINKTNDLLNFVMQDKEALRAYHMREMAQMDWNTGINTAEEKGHTKAQFEIAKNMLHEGLSVDIIQKTTGLDSETIQSLQ